MINQMLLFPENLEGASRLNELDGPVHPEGLNALTKILDQAISHDQRRGQGA